MIEILHYIINVLISEINLYKFLSFDWLQFYKHLDETIKYQIWYYTSR